MNRTLRAIESWQRYRSWVNIQQGPTGRERYISYGLYSLYDVRSELEKAEAATAQEPAIPDLDDAMRRYVQSYRALAPLITRANGYYERKDYEDDRMALGRDLHRQMVPAAEAFLKDRADVEAAMRGFRTDLNRRELADIERREGRSARWHVRNVLIAARGVMDLMPSNDAPRVNMAAFDGAIAAYAAALREMDKLKETDPTAPRSSTVRRAPGSAACGTIARNSPGPMATAAAPPAMNPCGSSTTTTRWYRCRRPGCGRDGEATCRARSAITRG